MSRTAPAPDPIPRAHHARKHRHGHRADDELPARRPSPGGAMTPPRKPRHPKPLRVLALLDKACVPPESIEGLAPEQVAPFKTEWDVCSTLQKLGHDVYKLAASDDLKSIRDAVDA